MRSATKRGIGKDPAYLQFIRSLPCCVCFRGYFIGGLWFHELDEDQKRSQKTRTEAAHTGPRGISQKSDDKTCVPLCAEHHREGRGAIHRAGNNFWTMHNIDSVKLIAYLNARYESERT